MSLFLRRIWIPAVLLALTTGPSLSGAFAQTGPVSSSPGGGPSQPSATGPVGGGLPGAPLFAPAPEITEANFGKYLRERGYRVEEVRQFDGRKMYLATIERNGWRFVVELSLSPDERTIAIQCHLGNPLKAGQATSERLLRLLEASRTQVGGHSFFSYRAADRRLVLYDFYMNNNQPPFSQYLDRVLADVMKSHAAWSWAS